MPRAVGRGGGTFRILGESGEEILLRYIPLGDSNGKKRWQRLQYS
ncbi:MAG: hypothetical protein R2706_08880 [Acidimicrobiales bacterium]